MPTLTALLARGRVPDRAGLQTQVRTAGFTELRIDDAWLPLGPRAYVPCTLDGEDAGFDLRSDALIPPPGDDRDTRLVLRWSGDPREEAAACIVCAALARDAGALVYAAGPDELLGHADLVQRARRLLAAL